MSRKPVPHGRPAAPPLFSWAHRGGGMGRKSIDDSAILHSMALGLVRKDYGNPWQASGVLSKEAEGGQSEQGESARRRIHRKFLKMEESLLREARKELGMEEATGGEEDEEAETIHGFNDEDFHKFARYLFKLKESERAAAIGKILIWRKEKWRLFEAILHYLRARGHRADQDDVLFIHTTLNAMEHRKMKWGEIFSEEPERTESKKDPSTDEK
jgi:hypothetical protein